MADASGYLWDHETGADYGDDAPYAESGPFELGEGETVMRVSEFVADEKTAGDVNVSFKVRNWPDGGETTYGPYAPSAPNSVRFAARQVRLRIDGDQATSWRWGVPRLRAKAGGRRG